MPGAEGIAVTAITFSILNYNASTESFSQEVIAVSVNDQGAR